MILLKKAIRDRYTCLDCRRLQAWNIVTVSARRKRLLASPPLAFYRALLALCVVLVVSLSGCSERSQSVAPGAAKTETSKIVLTDLHEGIKTLSGERLTREGLNGRWVLVNYWAEWCKPCAEEIPELNQFARQNAEAVVVLGVNYDGVTGAELRRQVQKLELDFAVAEEDPARLLGLPTPQVLPTTHVLDKQGHYHKTLVGPQTHASLAAALKD